MSFRLSWPLVSKILLCLTLLGCEHASPPPSAPRPDATTRVLPAVILQPSALVPVYAEDLSLGSLSAPITMVAFLDMECPFCARAWDTIERLREHYGSEQLRIVVKHLPLSFHEHAAPLARRLIEVQRQHGDPVAATVLKLALAGQTDLSEESLRGLTRLPGASADGDVARSHAYALTIEQQLDRDQALAARLGIDGTPAFRINGLSLTGAQPDTEFQQLIDSELLATKELLTKGVLPGELYARRVAENYRPPVDNEASQPEKDESRWAVPAGNSPHLGSPTAPVTVIAFMDYECPFCQRGFETLKQLHDRYPSSIRVVFKHRPLDFHEHAKDASQFAAAVQKLKGDAAFWSASVQLFAHRASLSSETYTQIAATIGLDAAALKQPALQRDCDAILEIDGDLADDFGVEGTPQFFVNGWRVKGARSIEEFSSLIDRELAQASALKAAGTAEQQLYGALTASAKPAPEPPTIDGAIALPNGPSTGNAKAPVTIHVFSDYQCPFCQRADATMRELLAKYPKETRLVWHDMPLGFHEHARAAATLAREVRAQKGDAVFFQLNHVLFEKQADLSEPALQSYALALGVRQEPLQGAQRERAHGESVDRDMKLAKELHITSTPTFVVGRYVVEGAQPLGRFERLLRRELARQSAQKHATLKR
jgi:protein-disulfide isomerase